MSATTTTNEKKIIALPSALHTHAGTFGAGKSGIVELDGVTWAWYWGQKDGQPLALQAMKAESIDILSKGEQALAYLRATGARAGKQASGEQVPTKPRTAEMELEEKPQASAKVKEAESRAQAAEAAARDAQAAVAALQAQMAELLARMAK